MKRDKQEYIEETGLVFENLGMTRMAGRIMGYLMICDKDAVSFDEIREAIQASKGSISGTIKQLNQIGFVEPVTYPGDRKTYYRTGKTRMGDLFKARMALIQTFVDSLIKGKRLKEREDEVSEWLVETASFYTWMDARMNELIERWEEEKDNVKKDFRKKTGL